MLGIAKQRASMCAKGTKKKKKTRPASAVSRDSCQIERQPRCADIKRTPRVWPAKEIQAGNWNAEYAGLITHEHACMCLCVFCAALHFRVLVCFSESLKLKIQLSHWDRSCSSVGPRWMKLFCCTNQCEEGNLRALGQTHVTRHGTRGHGGAMRRQTLAKLLWAAN